ncbi:MAG: hypothetical protein M8861_10235 [marine benthic group bacterium]|nr:hypothetical protein [Gemmatimonadota bacterium]
MRRPAVRILVATAGMCVASLALASGATAQDHGNPDSFWRASAYLWFANIDGTNYLGDSTVVVGDTSALRTSFAGLVEAGKGRFRGVGKFSTTSLSASGPLDGPGVPDGTEVDYDFTWTMATLLGTWQVGTFESSQALKLSAGLRYVHQSQDLAGSAGAVTQDWVEPVAGAEYWVEMGGPFWVSVDGDLGGFLFGSQFTMRVGAELGIHVTGPVHLSLAFDYLQTEYGEKGAAYRWDEGVSQGWYFGLTVKQ